MSEFNFVDEYGLETGTRSEYLKTYAARQEVFERLAETTTDNNLGNDFKEFERMHAAILKVQVQDMLVNLFEYQNIPATLNTAQLETMLRQFGGGVCVGRDTFGDLVILGRADELGYNMYGGIIPSYMDTEFLQNKRVITPRNLNGDFVVFYNKQSYLDFYSTDFEVVNHFCKLLASIKATERMNILQMRAPYLMKGNKNGTNSSVLSQKIMSGDLFIDIDLESQFDDKIGKIDLNIQDRTRTLQDAYRNTLNEMLTLFGIYNNPETKRERLTAGESSANNHIIEGMGDIYLNARRQAVNLVNLAFKTDIRVEWNSSVATMFRNLSNTR